MKTARRLHSVESEISSSVNIVTWLLRVSKDEYVESARYAGKAFSKRVINAVSKTNSIFCKKEVENAV